MCLVTGIGSKILSAATVACAATTSAAAGQYSEGADGPVENSWNILAVNSLSTGYLERAVVACDFGLMLSCSED